MPSHGSHQTCGLRRGMLTIPLSVISCLHLHMGDLGGIGWDDYLDPLAHRDISLHL